jgi:molybdenum cofactor cytidylyltransferase
MDEANKSIGIIVLAAGAASRMNEPKQLLHFEGKTLLRRAVETAIATNCEPVVIVLGVNFEKTSAEIKDLKVEICFNNDWQKGLSSSLKSGLKNLRGLAPNIDAFIVSLADQPFVTTNHFHQFVTKFQQTDHPIIAAKYGETIGVPALFAKETFDEFETISGDKGAKMLIEKHRRTLETIDLPEAAFDVDTKEDYLKLKSAHSE